MSEAATLIILAGGRSSRMGVPKRSLRSGGRTLIEGQQERLGARFRETLVVGGAIDGLPGGCRWLPDRTPGCGPLGGISTGLWEAGTDLCLVIACDMPHIRRELAALLLSSASDVDVAVPIVRGYEEPLCAAYRRRCAAAADRLLVEGRRAVRALYGIVSVHRVPESAVRAVDPDLHSFLNLNTPREASVHLEGAAASAVGEGRAPRSSELPSTLLP
jgi:molybdopterin-guanine dinucleotide biosynthesis protein A